MSNISYWENENFIDKDLINEFMDELYRRCGLSSFDMKRTMEDFIYSQEELLSKSELKKVIDDEVQYYREEITDLKFEIEDLNDEKYNLKKKIQELEDLSEEKNEIIKKLKRKIENSIFFSMDENE